MKNELSRIYPDRACLYFSFNEPLSHVVYAAADILVVPSMFEPCGLTQMIGMRYGSLHWICFWSPRLSLGTCLPQLPMASLPQVSCRPPGCPCTPCIQEEESWRWDEAFPKRKLRDGAGFRSRQSWVLGSNPVASVFPFSPHFFSFYVPPCLPAVAFITQMLRSGSWSRRMYGCLQLQERCYSN